MTTSKETYWLRIAACLGASQAVETELKSYIECAFRLVAKCCENRIPFKMDATEVQDMSLGLLIKRFKKLSDCPSLWERLQTFQRQREFVAHRSIIQYINPDGEWEDGSAQSDDLLQRLREIESEAAFLVEKIHLEECKFSPLLDFEVIKDDACSG